MANNTNLDAEYAQALASISQRNPEIISPKVASSYSGSSNSGTGGNGSPQNGGGTAIGSNSNVEGKTDSITIASNYLGSIAGQEYPYYTSPDGSTYTYASIVAVLMDGGLSIEDAVNEIRNPSTISTKIDEANTNIINNNLDNSIAESKNNEALKRKLESESEYTKKRSVSNALKKSIANRNSKTNSDYGNSYSDALANAASNSKTEQTENINAVNNIDNSTTNKFGAITQSTGFEGYQNGKSNENSKYNNENYGFNPKGSNIFKTSQSANFDNVNRIWNRAVQSYNAHNDYVNNKTENEDSDYSNSNKSVTSNKYPFNLEKNQFGAYVPNTGFKKY